MRSDLGTPELHKRKVIINAESQQTRYRSLDVSESPVCYYYHRGWVNDKQYDAAKLLYVKWYYGAMKVGELRALDLTAVKGLADLERAKQLQEEYDGAMASVAEQCRNVIYDIVLAGEWASDGQTSWKARSRMVLLRDGLDCLAAYFGL